jgi:flagellar biosynthetic protein FliR
VIAVNFGFPALEAELWRMMFIMTRIGAALLAAPIFSSAGVPVQLRVAITGAIAVLITAWTDVAAPPALLSIQGLLAVAGEILIGLSMGFVIQLTFAAPTIAAEVISGTMGMSMATAVDPNTSAGSTALGQYFSILLTLAFLAVDAHLHFVELIVQSYKVFPPGEAWLSTVQLQQILDFGGDMLVTAILLALPVTLLLLLVNVVTGVISRSAPSLNLFALGLPAGVFTGLIALVISAPLLNQQLLEVAGQAAADVETLLVSR